MLSVLRKFRKKKENNPVLTEKSLINIFTHMSKSNNVEARNIGLSGLNILKNKIGAKDEEYKKFNRLSRSINYDDPFCHYYGTHKDSIVRFAYPKISLKSFFGMTVVEVKKLNKEEQFKSITDRIWIVDGEYIVSDIDFTKYMDDFKELVNIDFQINELRKDLNEYHTKLSIYTDQIDNATVSLVEEKIASGYKRAETILANIRETEKFVIEDFDNVSQYNEYALNLFNKAMSVDF